MDHQFKKDDFEIVGDLTDICAQLVLENACTSHESVDQTELAGSKSTYGGMPCIFCDHTSILNSWACKKQTAVSHSSTEAEVISLDTGLRMEGLLLQRCWTL